MDTGTIRATEEEALQFHSSGRPGKLSIAPTKPLTTQRDLSLAYSPGVAFPCRHIHRRWHRSRCSILRTARFQRVSA
jgi:malate dehydrogenase (oxaloacetate-decarboxylating)(NADP+)